jgi:hypothetical protein
MTDLAKLETLRTEAKLHNAVAFIRTRQRRRFTHAIRSLARLALEIIVGSPSVLRAA